MSSKIFSYTENITLTLFIANNILLNYLLFFSNSQINLLSVQYLAIEYSINKFLFALLVFSNHTFLARAQKSR